MGGGGTTGIIFLITFSQLRERNTRLCYRDELANRFSLGFRQFFPLSRIKNSL